MGHADRNAVPCFGTVIARQAANQSSAAYMAGEQIDDIRGMLANDMRKALAGELEFVPIVQLNGKEKLQDAFTAIDSTLDHNGTDIALMAVLSMSRCPLVAILREKITAAYVDLTAEDLFNSRRGH